MNISNQKGHVHGKRKPPSRRNISTNLGKGTILLKKQPFIEIRVLKTKPPSSRM